MSKGIVFEKMNGSNLTIGIVKARWNSSITDALLAGCLQSLEECQVPKNNIVSLDVPGSFETVFGAQQLVLQSKVDAVVCLGVLIKGETMHFEYISEAVAHGIQQVALHHNIPVIFGILTCLNEAQAIDRSTGENNHGYGWGMSAVAMALSMTKIDG
jgi:6,7-dimethyl-8-ribityllumazine synthase